MRRRPRGRQDRGGAGAKALSIVAIAAVAALGYTGLKSCRHPDGDGQARSRWYEVPSEVRGEGTVAFKPGPPGAAPERGGRVVLALFGGDIDSFNPFTSSQNAELVQVHDLIFPRLAREDADYTEGPATFRAYLAESWSYEEDRRVLRFRLRECRWSDGAPITAEDVQFSFEAARDERVAWKHRHSLLDAVVSVDVRGEHELTVRFDRAYPYQLTDLCDVHIVPKHRFGTVPFAEWGKHGKWFEETREVAGGPWRPASYRPNQEIVLERNPRYWEEGRPYLDAVHFRVIDSTDALLAALLAGEIDVLRKVPFESTRQIREDGRFGLFSFQSRAYGYVVWNTKRPPFGDAKVRTALTHAIDRRDIAETFFGPQAKAGGPHILSSFWASDPTIAPLPYDRAQARKLLEEREFRPGSDGVLEKDGRRFAFKLLHVAGNQVRADICQKIAHQLEAVGVLVDVRAMPQQELLNALDAGAHDFDAALLGANAATKVDLKDEFHSKSVPPDGRNFGAYRNKRVDEIIDQARGATDLEQAAELWRKVQRILHEEQPVTMLYEERGYTAIDKKFQNVRVTSLSAYDNLHEWWVPRELQGER